MSVPERIAVAVAVAAVVVGVLVASTRLVGRIAERCGEDPRPWQLRMLPLPVFGPLLTWLLLGRRGGGGLA